MQFFTLQTITPAHKEITVDVYGIYHPKEKQTLEHQGNGAYAEVLKVTHNDVDISDYLSSDMWDEIETKCNQAKND